MKEKPVSVEQGQKLAKEVNWILLSEVVKKQNPLFPTDFFFRYYFACFFYQSLYGTLCLVTSYQYSPTLWNMANKQTCAMALPCQYQS